MDFQTEYRLHGYKYTAPERTTPCFTLRDLYREKEGHIFTSRRPDSHDCRLESTKQHCQKTDWEALLLAQGIRKTYETISSMHKLPAQEEDPKKRKPDKLLMTIGEQGSGDGDLRFPRGLTITDDGDIVIADTGNHRVQIFNQFGIFKRKFGNRGTEPGEFNEPTGVAIFPNEDIAVADKRNKRVQVFDPNGKFKYLFKTESEPWSVGCAENYNIIVATTNRSIIVFNRQGSKLHATDIGGPKEKGPSGVSLVVNDNDQIVVSDPLKRKAMFYSLDGRLLREFAPSPVSETLTCYNAGLAWASPGRLLICDSLNHTVNAYSEHGLLLEEVVAPVDEAGAVQACAVGPEGHLVVLEFTSNGPHCFKIFRFRDCECHRTRPGSAKKRPPTPQN